MDILCGYPEDGINYQSNYSNYLDELHDKGFTTLVDILERYCGAMEKRPCWEIIVAVLTALVEGMLSKVGSTSNVKTVDTFL